MMPGFPSNRALKLERLQYPHFQFNLQHRFRATHCPESPEMKAGFERQHATRAEDRLRREKLKCWASRMESRHAQPDAPPFAASDARRLAVRLKRVATGGTPPQSFASAAYMRRFRLRFVGAVLKLIQEDANSELRLITVIPQNWRVKGSDLPFVKPKQLLERFRQQLVRARLKETGGWMIVFLHGDYDPRHDTFQLHLHIVATDDLVPVFRRLKTLPAYRPGDGAEPGCIRQPIRILRLTNPERRVGYYLAQPFWPSRPSYFRDGVWLRHPRRQRIPDNRMAEWLMWIDRQGFNDLLMLRGCRLANGTLTLSRGP